MLHSSEKLDLLSNKGYPYWFFQSINIGFRFTMYDNFLKFCEHNFKWNLMTMLIITTTVVSFILCRRIEKPRILLLDCNLEYKKGESQTNIEIMKEEDFT